MNENSKKIAKNTLMLYFRQILILFVSLYTVRVVLNVLGVEDYGIYSVVGGIVTFFSFLSGSMASATQRFFSFAIGQNDYDKLNKTFSTNLLIYVFIAILSILLLETLGLWFVYNKLKLPETRFDAACWIYHFAVFTFVCTIISSPFMAIIIAHEDMQIYAYVSVIEVFFKLVIVFLLNLVSFDKLKLYSVMLFVVGFIIATIYLIVCLIRYKECQFRKFYFDKQLLKETIDFTGWTLFGQITTVARTQAVTVLMNQVFSPVVVAARTIATQVSNYINVFSTNFNTGLYPPIIKSYAENNKTEMYSLIFNGCKITFFLMWIFSLPLFFEMDFVLTLWLKQPPENAILFTRLALIEVLINSVSLPIATAARAPGKMKLYELTLGSLQIIIFITDLVLFLCFHVPAYFVFVVAGSINLIMLFVRIIIVNKLVGLPIGKMLGEVLLPIVFVILLSGMISFFIHKLLPQTFVFECVKILIMVSLAIFFMYILGLNKSQKTMIKKRVKEKFGRR